MDPHFGNVSALGSCSLCLFVFQGTAWALLAGDVSFVVGHHVNVVDHNFPFLSSCQRSAAHQPPTTQKAIIESRVLRSRVMALGFHGGGWPGSHAAQP